jgi:hypothetical protein
MLHERHALQRIRTTADRGRSRFAAQHVGDRLRRGSFPSQAATRATRDECLADSAARRTGDGWTLERWLRHWLETRTGSGRPPGCTTPLTSNSCSPFLSSTRLSELKEPCWRTQSKPSLAATGSQWRGLVRVRW